MVHTFIMTGLLAIGGYFLATASTVSTIAHFLPFTYLNVGKIVNGETTTVLNNSSIQTWFGIGVLLVSSVVLLGIGLACFQRTGQKKSKQKNISALSSH